MPGLSDAEAALSLILWREAELLDIAIDYSDVRVRIQESTGSERVLMCEGYLGYELVGFWDEIIIARATVTAVGELRARCLRSLDERLGRSRAASGSIARNVLDVLQLTIELDDATAIHVVASSFRTL